MNSNRSRLLIGRSGIASTLALCVALGLATPGCAENPNRDQDSTAVSAPANQAEAESSVKEQVSAETDKQMTGQREELLAEAADALDQTGKAIQALQNEDKQAALEALAVATGKLDLIVARAPELALAPVDVTATRQDVLGSIEEVEELRDDIEDLMDDDDIQAARPLVSAFGSEIRIETANLPLATYPEAIKGAAALIDEDKFEEARIVLETALSTLIIQEEVVPLPLVRARAMLEQAEAQIKGEETATADEEIDPQSLIENAAYQIELAEAFGYGDNSLYEGLKDDLDDLEDTLEAKQDSGGLFASIGEQIEKLLPSSWR